MPSSGNQRGPPIESPFGRPDFISNRGNPKRRKRDTENDHTLIDDISSQGNMFNQESDEGMENYPESPGYIRRRKRQLPMMNKGAPARNIPDSQQEYTAEDLFGISFPGLAEIPISIWIRLKFESGCLK